MNREAAIKLIDKAIKKQYGTQLAASKALNMNHIKISRIMTGITEQIDTKLLELAGLVAVEVPTTYKRSEGK